MNAPFALEGSNPEGKKRVQEYPAPEVLGAQTVGISQWSDGTFTVGWMQMTREQVRAFGEQLTAIADEEPA